MTITVDTMRSKLLSVEHAREVLGRTEPMQPVPFTVGDPIRFRAENDWNHGIKAKQGSEPVAVSVTMGRGRFATEYALSKETVQEVGLAFGLPRAYTLDCPAKLLIPHMNYWLREGLLTLPRKKKDFQFLVNDGTAIAFARQSLTPFSNLALLDQALASIEATYGSDGEEVLVDYKFSHTLRQTSVRLIVPGASRVLTGTGTDDDEWSVGIQLRNSLTGASQTSLEGYLFRWACTNGQIDTRSSSGVWTRRPSATEAEVYTWARHAVDEVLGGLEGSLDAVQAMTGVQVDGVSDLLRDIFEHYRLTIQQRQKIIKLITDYPGEITMYVVMNMITQTANESGLEDSSVDALMRVGGDLPYTAGERCKSDNPCGRMLHTH